MANLLGQAAESSPPQQPAEPPKPQLHDVKYEKREIKATKPGDRKLIMKDVSLPHFGLVQIDASSNEVVIPDVEFVITHGNRFTFRGRTIPLPPGIKLQGREARFPISYLLRKNIEVTRDKVILKNERPAFTREEIKVRKSETFQVSAETHKSFAEAVAKHYKVLRMMNEAGVDTYRQDKAAQLFLKDFGDFLQDLNAKKIGDIPEAELIVKATEYLNDPSRVDRLTSASQIAILQVRQLATGWTNHVEIKGGLFTHQKNVEDAIVKKKNREFIDLDPSKNFYAAFYFADDHSVLAEDVEVDKAIAVAKKLVAARYNYIVASGCTDAKAVRSMVFTHNAIINHPPEVIAILTRDNIDVDSPAAVEVLTAYNTEKALREAQAKQQKDQLPLQTIEKEIARLNRVKAKGADATRQQNDENNRNTIKQTIDDLTEESEQISQVIRLSNEQTTNQHNQAKLKETCRLKRLRIKGRSGVFSAEDVFGDGGILEGLRRDLEPFIEKEAALTNAQEILARRQANMTAYYQGGGAENEKVTEQLQTALETAEHEVERLQREVKNDTAKKNTIQKQITFIEQNQRMQQAQTDYETYSELTEDQKMIQEEVDGRIAIINRLNGRISSGTPTIEMARRLTEIAEQIKTEKSKTDVSFEQEIDQVIGQYELCRSILGDNQTEVLRRVHIPPRIDRTDLPDYIPRNTPEWYLRVIATVGGEQILQPGVQNTDNASRYRELSTLFKDSRVMSILDSTGEVRRLITISQSMGPKRITLDQLNNGLSSTETEQSNKEFSEVFDTQAMMTIIKAYEQLIIDRNFSKNPYGGERFP